MFWFDVVTLGQGVSALRGMYLAKRAAAAVPTGEYYSVAFQMELPGTLYPGINAGLVVIINKKY